MYNSILVPLDGSRNSEWALPTAISIARATGARISLLTIQVPVPVLAVGMSILQPSPSEVQFTPSPEYLREVADRIAESGVLTVTLGVVEPSAMALTAVGTEIARRAELTHAGLIVMTTHARALVPRMFMGSVARDVVRASRAPVLLVRPQPDRAPELSHVVTFRNILVPLDGSSFSEEVLSDAVELGRLADAHFTLLRVIQPRFIAGVPVEPALPPIDDIAVGELKRMAQAQLDRVAERLRKRGLQVATKLVADGGAGEVIERVSHATGADLIAMTTHARGGFGTLLLGSVANHVIRSASVPVLMYRPREA